MLPIIALGGPVSPDCRKICRRRIRGYVDAARNEDALVGSDVIGSEGGGGHKGRTAQHLTAFGATTIRPSEQRFEYGN